MARILITGAGGRLARSAIERLRARGGLELRLTDRRAGPGIVAADLARPDADWEGLLEGCAAVLHLAGEPRPHAPWDDVIPANIDATDHLLLAAAAMGTPRVVLASSNWVMAGHRFGRGPLTPRTPPRPINAYGASKLCNERLGEAVAARFGLCVIALRIGYCADPPNRPGPHMRFGRWGQRMWLSTTDWQSAAEAALLHPATGYHALNVMSANPGMRWDLGPSREAIGYVPRDGHAARGGIAMAARARVARARHRLLARWSGPHRGWDW